MNGWIVFHFFAVCTAPASIPPSPALARSAWRMCSGYLQALYLNHGYHFFAPDPGGATLLSYEATRSDGSSDWNRLPDRQLSPRLRYHRHFLLTEQMAALFRARPDLKPLIVHSFAAQIARQQQATAVTMSQVQHELSTPDQVRAGRAIDDPITYNELWLGEFKWHSAPRSD
ncbi:hypothetical protein [Rosistilla carotiformis]|uniref:hypothetical protein n=1 Tax=Rosistilla carotiformis TaxID=2528017 RepID=UPI001E462181|nr:hypothetical protein [Rosistilla carotiformis]